MYNLKKPHKMRIPKYLAVCLLCIIYLPGCLSSDKKDTSTLKDVIENLNGEPVIPREANKIFIPVFNNFTNISSISEKLTIKLKKQINIDGRLTAISENTQADLKLLGIILSYQVQPVKYGNIGEPVLKRLRIIASVKLIDLHKNKDIFYERGIQAFEEFSELVHPIYSEIQIQDKVLDNLAKRIALKTINGWYTKLMTPIEKGKK